MLDFSQLSPLMRELHAECVRIYYLAMPVFLALAILIQWFKRGQGSVDLLNLVKRTMISTLLLIAFPEIADAIIAISEGVAARIDAVQSLDSFISIAEEKVNGYSASPSSLLLGFNDLFLACLTFLSFFILYIARYLTLGMFHFFWLFYVVTAPLLLLFMVFSETANITSNLFRGMIEIACWKIVWAILGVMLASLSFGQMYMVEGSYVTVIVMNAVIAIAMLATPLFVRSLVGSGAQALSPMLGTSAVASLLKVYRNAAVLKRGAAFPGVRRPTRIETSRASGSYYSGSRKQSANSVPKPPN